MITSEGNAQIKEIEKLQKKGKYRKELGLFPVEGRKMVLEAGDRLKRVYLSESYDKEYGHEGFQDWELISDKVFKSISDTMTPQGILGLVQLPDYSLSELLEKERIQLLLLEDVRDPGNLGTMVRTAEAAGVTGIILSRTSVDIFNPKVLRSTMGAIYRMPFVYVDDFYKTLEELKKKDITLYAAHLKGKGSYDEEAYREKSGILIGNEAKGLTDEAAGCANRLVKIPMEGEVESLNAAVAAAVLMYEIYRQRRMGK